MEPQARQNDVSHISVDKAGRVLIPSAMRERYGIHQGDRVVLQADDTGIHITTLDQAVKNAQAILRPLHQARRQRRGRLDSGTPRRSGA